MPGCWSCVWVVRDGAVGGVGVGFGDWVMACGVGVAVVIAVVMAVVMMMMILGGPSSVVLVRRCFAGTKDTSVVLELLDAACVSGPRVFTCRLLAGVGEELENCEEVFFGAFGRTGEGNDEGFVAGACHWTGHHCD